MSELGYGISASCRWWWQWSLSSSWFSVWECTHESLFYFWLSDDKSFRGSTWSNTQPSCSWIPRARFFGDELTQSHISLGRMVFKMQGQGEVWRRIEGKDWGLYTYVRFRVEIDTVLELQTLYADSEDADYHDCSSRSCPLESVFVPHLSCQMIKWVLLRPIAAWCSLSWALVSFRDELSQSHMSISFWIFYTEKTKVRERVKRAKRENLGVYIPVLKRNLRCLAGRIVMMMTIVILSIVAMRL